MDGLSDRPCGVAAAPRGGEGRHRREGSDALPGAAVGQAFGGPFEAAGSPPAPQRHRGDRELGRLPAFPGIGAGGGRRHGNLAAGATALLHGDTEPAVAFRGALAWRSAAAGPPGIGAGGHGGRGGRGQPGTEPAAARRGMPSVHALAPTGRFGRGIQPSTGRAACRPRTARADDTPDPGGGGPEAAIEARDSGRSRSPERSRSCTASTRHSSGLSFA